MASEKGVDQGADHENTRATEEALCRVVLLIHKCTANYTKMMRIHYSFGKRTDWFSASTEG